MVASLNISRLNQMLTKVPLARNGQCGISLIAGITNYAKGIIGEPKALFTTTQFERTNVNVTKVEKSNRDGLW